MSRLHWRYQCAGRPTSIGDGPADRCRHSWPSVRYDIKKITWYESTAKSLHPCVCVPSADPRYIKIFVLDEADEMLSRGFKDQIYDVFRKLPSNTQVAVACELTTLLLFICV